MLFMSELFVVLDLALLPQETFFCWTTGASGAAAVLDRQSIIVLDTLRFYLKTFAENRPASHANKALLKRRNCISKNRALSVTFDPTAVVRK